MTTGAQQNQVGPTKRQRAVLDFIRAFIEAHGGSPSLEEIGRGVGATSLATIHKHLVNLRDKGLLSWRDGHKRTLQLHDDICPVCKRKYDAPTATTSAA